MDKLLKEYKAAEIEVMAAGRRQNLFRLQGPV